MLYGDHAMAETAEEVGKNLTVGRDESDKFAYASQQRYAKAKSVCFYQDELHPVEVPDRKGAVTRVTDDEHPRPGTTLESDLVAAAC